MRSRPIACIVLCCVCLGLFSGFVVADYGGGDGSSEFPFLISEPAHLIAIGENPHHWDKHFILMDNINLEGATITPIAPTEDPQGWPFVGTIFSGVFDGNNKVISNFEIDQPNSNFTGFFGYIGNGGQVKDLGLENIKISGDGSTGGLAGYIDDFGNWGTTISNCYVLGEIIGNSGVGGLCGVNNYATIELSYTEGVISGNDGVGGLCGYLNYGTLNKSYAAGTVSGHNNVGGLVGQNYFGEVLSCFATCEVTGHTYVGGLCGHNHFNTISNSYATGAVSGTEHVGGLMGRNYWGKVVCCYSTGKTTGIWNVGGLVGSAESGEGYEDTANRWDIDTSEVSDSAMGLGRTTEDMQTRLTHTYPFFTWDFEEFWCMPYRGYPLLRWQTGYSGPSHAYMIFEPTQLLALGGDPDHWNEYFILTADIDMAGHDWTADNFIGKNMSSNFSGTFDGDGHVIKNLNIDIHSGSRVGLFGYVYSGTVKNLGLVDVTISIQTGANIGGLVGNLQMYGNIENCYTIYKITVGDSIQHVGGLVGGTEYANISNSFSRGTITTGTSASSIGGLVGATSATTTLTDSHSAGSISAGNSSSGIGGLVGRHNGNEIKRCYSTVDVNAGPAQRVGGLVGQHWRGDIRDSFSTGSVNGNFTVGGFVGESTINTFGMISNCYSTGDVRIGKDGGGLVGRATGVKIIDCHSTGTVIADVLATGGVGGLVGSLWHSEHATTTIENSYSTSSVTGGYPLGGLVGVAYHSSIKGCYSAGSVELQSSIGDVGGLIGSHIRTGISNSYSVSSVSGGPTTHSRVGGFIGNSDGQLQPVAHCFSAGLVSRGISQYAGGFIGELQSGQVVTCFWDTETSGMGNSAGGTGVLGLPTADMQNEMTFSWSGWDFDDVWMMFDYPGLQWQPEIGVSRVFSVSVPAGRESVIEFEVFGLRNAAINWAMQGHQDSDWITEASPVSGSSNGPSDVTQVSITVNSDGLAIGRHAQELTLIANEKVLAVPIVINVYNPVDFEIFSTLASHWMTDDCDFGQPCKEADWYVDGVIDIKDVLQLAESWLGEEIIKVRATVTEGFESGDFSVLDWQHDGAADWIIVDSGAYEGTYAAKSGQIDNFQESTLEVTLDLTGWEVNTIGFAGRVSSRQHYHYLRFYIDGQEKGAWSGENINYSYRTYQITPGLRTFAWTYSKGPGEPVGQDCAWIDNIRIYAQ